MNLRITTILFLTGLFWVGLGQTNAFAQAKVAIVDVGQIFKSHPSFSGQLKELKVLADNFKEETVQLQQQLKQKAQGIQANYAKETDEFRKAETELAQDVAALEIKQKNKLRGLMEREAQLHYGTYTEIKAAIEKYCEERQIGLVLRHNGQQMDPENPGSIMQQVNGKVVFYRPESEITSQIIGMLGK